MYAVILHQGLRTDAAGKGMGIKMDRIRRKGGVRIVFA